MQKQEKMYRNGKKAGEALTADMQTRAATVMQQYRLKPEQDIEEVLSPFWAWRSLTH